MKFNKFLQRINKDYEEIVSKEPSLASIKLDVDLSKIRGKDFYRVLILITEDFDKDCKTALFEIAEGAKKKYQNKYSKKGKENKSLNSYQEFINQFIVLQSDIAENASIENTRFTKVLNQQANDFYAYEVYSIVISRGITAKSAFEQLYKNYRREI